MNMKPLFPVASYVTGVTFGKRQNAIAELENGDPLFFKRETGNPYDREAIAILDTQGRHIGYLPNKPSSAHEFKHMIFRCMDDGIFNVIACQKRGGYADKAYGISVKFYFIPNDYLLRGMEAKDADDPVPLPKRKNTTQKPKRTGNEWKDQIKRRHKGRYSYHEIEAFKERSAA